jgi:hypothetical protein
MNWPAIESALAALVASVAGISSKGTIAWKGKPASGAFRQGMRIDLSRSGARAQGRDEVRFTTDPDRPLDQGVANVCGPRQFTWTVRIEVPRSNSDELATMDVLRAGVVKFERAKTLLHAAGLAVASVGPTAVVEFTRDSRELAVAVTDFIMNAAENIRDTSDGAGDWVESAEIESSEAFVNTDGTTVDPPIEFEVSR